jgi:hypothetical protein
MKMLVVLLGIAVASTTLALTAIGAESGGATQKGKLRHVVAFKFKESASKDDIKKVETAFRDLKKKIKEIVSYEWGMNNSPENKNRGCTHAFILEKDRDAYLVHPEHKAFGKIVGPVLDEVFVIDFWAEE